MYDMIRNLFKKKKLLTATMAGIPVSRYGYDAESKYEWNGHFNALRTDGELMVSYRNEDERHRLEEQLTLALQNEEAIIISLKKDAWKHGVNWLPDDEGIKLFADSQSGLTVNYYTFDQKHAVAIHLNDGHADYIDFFNACS